MSFPGGSKSRVNRAGDRVRAGTADDSDLRVIDEWRAAHRHVLNTFQAILRTRTRDLPITVAQRHKRRNTIFEKLHRLPKMQLARMDDVAGCRLIFNSNRKLYQFRKSFLNARFNHHRKNDVDKYDYLKNPKSTGYRGIHDVYSYDVNSAAGRELKGLMVEIQYRTLTQHAWATAVEVIGHITESRPKFEQGDIRYQDAMAYASEILARTAEKMNGPHPDLTDKQLVKQFQKLDKKLGLLETLSELNSVDSTFATNKNTILLISPDGELKVKTYRTSTKAMKTLFDLEESGPNNDVVLVRANSSDDVRLAFRNYFSDATDFVKLINKGCAKLLNPPRTIKTRHPKRRK